MSNVAIVMLEQTISFWKNVGLFEGMAWSLQTILSYCADCSFADHFVLVRLACLYC